MIVTIFRSHLNPPTIDGEYDHLVDTTSALVEHAPGFVSHKMFFAEDGERLTIVEFESEATQRAWAASAEHVEARRAGRKRLYKDYSIQICEVVRESKFETKLTFETTPQPATSDSQLEPVAAQRCPFSVAVAGSTAAPS